VAIPRRSLLRMVGTAIALGGSRQIAKAQAYPTRPVRFLVGYAPGVAPDIVASVIAPWLSERLGRQFVVDNRPGAASNIATEIAAKAAPDGYTLLMVVATNAINATLYPNLSFDFGRDLLPVAGIGSTAFVMTVNPQLPAKTLSEFLAYAKANPGKVTMASGGVGTTPHVVGELLKMMSSVDWLDVPYRGNYMPDLLSGQVALAFPAIVSAIEFIKDGRLRALAVTTAKRSSTLPDVPTVGEFVPGYEASGWYGICAPRGMPADIIAKLNAAISAAVADPNVKQRLALLGVEPQSMTPGEFGTLIDGEIQKWAKVIKFAHIKPD